jgi:hypothetical protein
MIFMGYIGLNDIQKLTDKEFIKDVLEKQILNSSYTNKNDSLYSSYAYINFGFGDGAHAALKHIQSDEELIYRLKTEKLKSSSAFRNNEKHECCHTDLEYFNFILCDTLKYYEEEIANWITNTRDKEFIIENNCLFETVGSGFKKEYNPETEKWEIRELETEYLNIVLQRDYTSLTTTGFSVKTMYPNIEHEEAVDITDPEKIAKLEKIVNERIEKENFEKELNRLKNKCSEKLEQCDCSDKEKEKYLHEIDNMIKNITDDIDKNEGYSSQDILQFIKDTYVKDFTNVFESIKQENNNKENKVINDTDIEYDDR